MATSKLQRYTSGLLGIYLSKYEIYENKRYDWLDGKELDFYIPEMNIAIEVQGEQHYTYIPYFHKTYDDFIKRKETDIMKKDKCIKNNIVLYEVFSEDDARELIINLSQGIRNTKYSVLDYYNTTPLTKNQTTLSNQERNIGKKIRHCKTIKQKERIMTFISQLIFSSAKHNYEIKNGDVIRFYNSNKNEIDKKISLRSPASD